MNCRAIRVIEGDTVMTTAENRTTSHDDGLSAFMSVRSRLFGIAYRMLGSAAEADDVVQDVWVRWQTADRSRVQNPAAFLAKTATRLAINVIVLVLLQKLRPTERAAYVLREAFDYAYRDIARILRLEEDNARQVVTRARQHVAHGERMVATSTEHRRLLDAFVAAAQHGDVARLEGVLASDLSVAPCAVAA
jgi:DNA-directed RNA polymerase specialized sigma24 family protein